MIKGLYNENEFYTNFYWDSKLIEDIRSKLEPSADLKVGELKALDGLFWKLKELSINERAPTDALVNFYSAVFKTLGFQFQAKLNQTSDGASYTSFISETKAGSLELFGLLTDYVETGTFETEPILIKAEDDIEVSSNDLQFTDLLREELLESESPPRWVLIGSPSALFIIERSKWSVGRYLRIEWQEIFLQRDSKPYEIILGICSKKSLCPEAGNSSHDEFDDNSHRHAFEVTTELRESVREAIELLINEMIDLKKESHQKIYTAETSDQYAKELTHDALYYVYRLLFLLYLEAQGEDSDLLPLKSEIYRNGYSLEKLLELDFVDIAPNSAESNGTFLFESLDQIFNLIFFGFEPGVKEGLLKAEYSQTGFLIKGVKSELFDPASLRHIKGVKLTNGVLLDILKKLSLNRKRERGGKPRARVSYANLGINQLGAVYEGLLSYTGFFAQEDLHALKPISVKQSDIDNGKELAQVYLVQKSLVEKYRRSRHAKYKLTDENTVLDTNGDPKIYKKGSFIYRLAGRDRQKLASYYTPESLTKCTVKYSLNVLLETKNTLNDLWKIKILEPAMGSGAFLNEAVNQLSEKILDLEVKQEVNHLNSPKEKKKRLWEIKYELISKNIFGVDLNPTAVELARFSLWLNCIGAGKAPPSFEGRLKVGNSLIGARFKKTADGFYPWLQLDERILSYDFRKLSVYDPDNIETLKLAKAQLQESKLPPNHQLLNQVQQLAEERMSAFANAKDTTAYSQLKACCDLWCSLFFISQGDLMNVPNTHEGLLEVFHKILNSEQGPEIDEVKSVSNKITELENFFHWDLEFNDILSAQAFDLILGNPPWVAVEWQDSLFVSDENALPALRELNASETREFIEHLDDENINSYLAGQFLRVNGYSNLLSVDFYSLLNGVQKNTYKAFDILAFSLLSESGVFGVIQEDGIFEDKQAALVRQLFYRKLRFHFQFQNELDLFSEVAHTKRYSVNIFSSSDSKEFDHIGSLFVPSTIEECYLNSSTQSCGGIKNAQNEWNTRGNAARVINVSNTVLSDFNVFLGQTSDSIFLNLFSQDILEVIRRINSNTTPASRRFSEAPLIGSECFHEVNAQDRGLISKSPGPPIRPDCIVLSGPHISNSNPIFQEARDPYINKSSYNEVNLEQVPESFLPRVVFQPAKPNSEIDATLPMVGSTPYRLSYKIVCKGMLNLVIERSLYSALLPPGYCHINGLKSCSSTDLRSLVILAGYFQSIFYEFIVRIKNKTNFFPADFGDFPMGSNSNFEGSILRRVIALNGLTRNFDELWRIHSEQSDTLSNGQQLTGFGQGYSVGNTLRSSANREVAMAEIDVLVGLSLGLDIGQIENVFDVYFSVMAEYDRKSNFDRKSVYKNAFDIFVARGW